MEEAQKIFYKKSDNEIEWTAYEFTYHEKDTRWLVSFWIIAGAFFISALIAKNIFGAAVIALFAVVLYIYALKYPEIMHCNITRQGVTLNGRLFPFNTISSFWILYEPPVKELILISKHRVMPRIVMPLETADPVEIISEKEEEEPFSNIIARKLRF